MPVRKVGALSTKEMEFIKANSNTMSVKEMAQKLNRTVKPIEKYISKLSLTKIDQSEEEKVQTRIKEKLHSEFFWSELTRQLDRDGLRYFEGAWIAYMQQCKEDILDSEKTILKQFIIGDIMAGSILRERNKLLQELDVVQKRVVKLLKEREKFLPNDKEYMELDIKINMANSEKQEISAQFNTYSKEYNEYVDKNNAMAKNLKISRDQRKKIVEESKGSFVGFAKLWDSAIIRKEEGEEAELFRLAIDKRKKVLSEYHTYADGMLDQPILTTETLINED